MCWHAVAFLVSSHQLELSPPLNHSNDTNLSTRHTWSCPCLTAFSLAVSPAWHALPSPWLQISSPFWRFSDSLSALVNPHPSLSNPLLYLIYHRGLFTSCDDHIYSLVVYCLCPLPHERQLHEGRDLFCWVKDEMERGLETGMLGHRLY